MRPNDKTGYPLAIGSFIRADKIPGTRSNVRGKIERLEGNVVWIRVERGGVRPFHPETLEVLTMSATQAKRPLWARRIARNAVFAQKPRARR